VRYVLLRTNEPNAEDLSTQLGAAGYRVNFQAGNAQVWENPANGDYAQFYGSAALDVTQDFHYPFQALPKFLWRGIAMVTPPSFQLDDYSSAELARYKYLLVDEPVTRDPAQRQAILANLGEKLVKANGLDSLQAAIPVHADVWIERLSYEDIYLKVWAPQAGVLSISESWYPHWRVQVDGQPGQVLRVNWALLGVWVEPGEHIIIFHFQRPWYVYLAFGITLLTVLALIAWWTWRLDIFRRPSVLVWEGEPSSQER
jgi:hypothetical protein